MLPDDDTLQAAILVLVGASVGGVGVVATWIREAVRGKGDRDRKEIERRRANGEEHAKRVLTSLYDARKKLHSELERAVKGDRAEHRHFFELDELFAISNEADLIPDATLRSLLHGGINILLESREDHYGPIGLSPLDRQGQLVLDMTGSVAAFLRGDAIPKDVLRQVIAAQSDHNEL